MADLTDDQRAMLDFEREHWRYPAGKDVEVRRLFGTNLVGYQQRLSVLIDQPAALAYAPATVRRLRRLRQRRIAERRENRTSA